MLWPCRIGVMDLLNFQQKQVMYVDFYVKMHLLSMSAMDLLRNQDQITKTNIPMLAMIVQEV